MKRNEKIEKLERLGIFNQWKYNTERANETFNIECPDFSMTNEERMNNLLDVDCCFHRYDNKAHALQLRINRSSGDERRKYTKEQEDLLHKELPQTLRDEKVDEIVGREIPVDCRTDYFSIDKFVITEVDKDGSILLNGKILFNVNFEREYDLGYVGLTTDLCDMAGTAYNSKSSI